MGGVDGAGRGAGSVFTRLPRPPSRKIAAAAAAVRVVPSSRRRVMAAPPCAVAVDGGSCVRAGVIARCQRQTYLRLSPSRRLLGSAIPSAARLVGCRAGLPVARPGCRSTLSARRRPQRTVDPPARPSQIPPNYACVTGMLLPYFDHQAAGLVHANGLPSPAHDQPESNTLSGASTGQLKTPAGRTNQCG